MNFESMQNKLIIITAPSGAGKTTTVKHLLENIPHLAFSVSATTRKKRDNETDGKDYYFISESEFKKKIDNNEFLEWEEVYKGIFYGSLKSEVERLWKMRKTVVFDIDVTGALNLKKFYGGKALSLFIKPPSKEILLQRLKSRATENSKSLEERIRKAESELQYESKFDTVILNDDLQKAVEKTQRIVLEFCNKDE